MSKTTLSLLISATLLLSACNDEEVRSLKEQLQTSRQQIAQLQAELQQTNATSTIKADSAQPEAAISPTEDTAIQDKIIQDEIPTLYVKPVTVFDKTEKFNFNVSKKPKNNEPLYEESHIHYAMHTVETGIEWLDSLLYQNLMADITIEDADKQKEFESIPNAKDRYAAFIEYFYNNALPEIKNGTTLGSDYYINLDYVGQRENILTFKVANYMYDGGAHGMYSTDYINIDSRKKAVIDLNTLVNKDKQNQLKELLWKSYLAYTNNDNSDIPFTEKQDFDISQQFYFSSEGVNFVYPPYALGSFAEGEITLSISWSDAKNIINKDYLREGFTIQE
ncbi:DUF3298 domain-containing protein [Basfia succiniciproducens]|uniref:DUF3298 and DUF4163 domain-containing protein n=1 Tax=Basfia succiniciproducens TaxID=653940 RepID=UPI003FCD803D